jgi:hypothetical protein
MRGLVVVALLSMLVGNYAASSEYSVITYQEMEQISLTAIDNICGDSWCEGEYDYSFDSLKCDYFGRSECVLKFQYIEWGDFGVQFPDGRVVAKHSATCSVPGITSYEQMLEDFAGLLQRGEWHWAQLTDLMYENVGECIEQFYPPQ